MVSLQLEREGASVKEILLYFPHSIYKILHLMSAFHMRLGSPQRSPILTCLICEFYAPPDSKQVRKSKKVSG
jgi:hypothetical protein